MGASGTTLKVVMAYKLADDRALESLNESECVLFHANAYCKAVDFLQANTGLRGDGIGCNPDDGCRISADDKAFVNENVVPIIMDMPTTLPEYQLVANDEMADQQPQGNALPGYSEVEMNVIRFNLVRRTLNIEPQGEDAVDIITLAEACVARVE